MRDYVLFQARFQDSAYAFPALRRLLRNWLARRQLGRLRALDEYLLNDIGLTRDDIRWGLNLPRHVDAVAALDGIREQRMARGVRRK